MDRYRSTLEADGLPATAANGTRLTLADAIHKQVAPHWARRSDGLC